MKSTAGALLALTVLFSLTGCGGGDSDVVTPDVLSLEKAAEKAAVTASEKSMTYNYGTLDADFDWVDDLATKQFRENFAEASEPVREAVEAGSVDARAEVLEAAADYKDATHIDVLLFVDQSLVSEKDKAAPSLEQHRIKMQMVLQDGKWLVDKVEVVNRG